MIYSLFWTFFALSVPFLFAGVFDNSSDGKDLENDHRDDDSSSDEADFNINAKDVLQYQEDQEKLNARINEIAAELEADSKPDAEKQITLQKELAQALLSRALGYQEAEDFEESLVDFRHAIDILTKVCKEDYSSETARMLGLAHLSYAVVLNDCSAWDEASKEYKNAAELMRPLAEQGNQEARLDLAGILLNRASVLLELDELTEAREILDDCVERFESISQGNIVNQDEALFYLAKTYSVIADVLEAEDENEERENIEEIRKKIHQVVDIYRALVTKGHSEHKYDLADALLNAVRHHMGENDQETLGMIEEAVGLFKDSVLTGQNEACLDLFQAQIQQAELLYGMARYEETVQVCNDILEFFKPFQDSEEPMLLNDMATVYENRGLAQTEYKNAVADLSESIRIRYHLINVFDKARKAGGAEHKHSCCGGHHHEEGEHSCCGGHHHEEGEHSCCGGHHHEEGEHSCCGGHHHGEESLFVGELENLGGLAMNYFHRARSYQGMKRYEEAFMDCESANKVLNRIHGLVSDFEEFDMLVNDLKNLQHELENAMK